MIHIVTSSRYRIHKTSLLRNTESLLRKYEVTEDAVLNIAFVGKRKMREISNTYKHEDVALPVLAFPYKEETVENERLLGEIVLCYPQVVLLAAERSKKLDDMMFQLIEHGLKNLLK
ncbi:MAG: rRNA maturation RNase YbeY [Patescibacteria group bacterium]